MPESAETGDIGDAVGDFDNRSVAVDRIQPVFVVISNQMADTVPMAPLRCQGGGDVVPRL